MFKGELAEALLEVQIQPHQASLLLSKKLRLRETTQNLGRWINEICHLSAVTD